MYDIKLWYKWGLWTADMVLEAVPDLLSEQEANDIIAEKVLVNNTSANKG